MWRLKKQKHIHMKHKLLCAFFAMSTLSAFTQKNYWHPVSQSSASRMNGGKAFFADGFQPADYKLFTLTEDALASALKQAQSEKDLSAGIIIYVPVANGNVERFRIIESSVMDQQLQARHPGIRSYIGQGVDDASKTIACSFTPLGFHASIMAVDEKTMYINPVNKNANLYSVLSRNENDRSANKLKCEVDGSLQTEKITVNRTAPKGNADDGKLRTYRLALCTTGEWSRFFITGSEHSHQDSINTVMAAITVDLVRANQVYERDLGIHMNFVANEDTIIFLNPVTDPFTLSNLNSKCQQTCDSYIGDANYDIGHVIAKGSDNGNAGCIACVCRTGSKGSGMSTYSNPGLTDYFVIDYWTHEMGHQYGANHTFTFSNEGTSAQIEPGSGSTIMGYAGITGSTDVQPHSDDLFSTASIAQITNYIKLVSGGGKCAVATVTGDHAPTANGGADHVIPVSTAFMLTGKATDADASDHLSYIWEQVDAWETGSNTFPKTTSTKGPVFRAFNYTNSKFRVFPAQATILTGATFSKWEAVPSVSRDLNFRLTVRDNHAGGGNNKSDDVLITVTNTAGPFVVTAPNTAVSWAGGSNKNVTWNVANTNAAPVNCANVSIMISFNGGNTFKTIVNSTPNDGSQQIVVPNTATTQARIAVLAADNVFLDVSDVNFTITATEAVAKTSSDASAVAINNGKWSVQPNPAKDFTNIVFNSAQKNVEIILSDASGKILSRKTLEAVNEGSIEKISLHNLNKGSYFIKISSDSGTKTEKVIIN
jgi:hypothetical protein